MSFWDSTPLPTAANRSQRFAHVPPPPPLPQIASSTASSTPYTFSFANEKDVPALQQFLLQHFSSHRDPKASPQLHLPLHPSPDERLLQATDCSGALVGCIRFKKSGNFEGHVLSLVDAFCVRPDHRKAGLATSLLSKLRSETRDRPYSLFLKEGSPLPIPQAPLYTSLYVYCRPHATTPAPITGTILSPSRPIVQAYIRAYQTLRPDTFVCWNPEGTNQHWRLFRDGRQWLLVCVQDAYQTIEKEQIGWMTALFESFVPLQQRAAVLQRLLQTTPFPWIWTDQVFAAPDLRGWQLDGPFHWYAHGWTTSLRPGANYAIVV